MNKYFFIITKLINLNYNKFSFSTFVTYLTIFCTALSVSFIVLTFSINTSFKNVIKEKIIKHDGFVEIYSNKPGNISKSSYNALYDNLSLNYKISPVISKEVIVRNGSKSQACYLKGVNLDEDVYNLFSVLDKGEIDKTGLHVGLRLFEYLNLEINDNLNIIYNDNSNMSILTLPVVGVFRTSIPEFDNYSMFCDYSYLSKLSFKNSIESISLNFKNNVNLNDSISLDSSDFNYFYWNEKYSSFLDWLNSYDGPVNILLSFIILICFFNILSSFYVDSIFRIKDLYLINLLGLSKRSISLIFSFRSSFFSFLGSSLGLFAVLIFQYIQNNFHLIKIPEYIYYMKYLPIKINFFISFVFILLLTFLSFILSLIVFKLFIKKNITLIK